MDSGDTEKVKTSPIIFALFYSILTPQSLAGVVGITIDWPTELSVSCKPATGGRMPGRTDLVVSVAGLEVGRAYEVKLEGYNDGPRYVSPRSTRDPSFMYKEVWPGQYEVRVTDHIDGKVIGAKAITITAPEPKLSAPAAIGANTPITVSLSDAVGPYQRGWLYLTLVPAHYPLNERGPGRNSIKEACDEVQHEFKGLPAGKYELRLFQSIASEDPLLAKRAIVVGGAVANDAKSQGNGQVPQCWRLPNGSSMQATANSTPPIAGSILGACGTTSIPSIHISLPQQQMPTPSTLKRGVVKLSLGTGNNSDNCVFFARDRVPTLPTGLDTWQGKLNAINSGSPQVGSVAMIGFSTGAYRDIGHAAVVESIRGNSITIIEANYTPGQITRRTATGVDLADAARQLGIAGYYRP